MGSIRGPNLVELVVAMVSSILGKRVRTIADTCPKLPTHPTVDLPTTETTDRPVGPSRWVERSRSTPPHLACVWWPGYEGEGRHRSNWKAPQSRHWSDRRALRSRHRTSRRSPQSRHWRSRGGASQGHRSRSGGRRDPGTGIYSSPSPHYS